MSDNCCVRTKHRQDDEKNDLINRLSRIEGQVRGLRGMVEKDSYCADVLMQASAARAALNSFIREILRTHIKTCVIDDIRAGNDETADELIVMLQQLMK